LPLLLAVPFGPLLAWKRGDIVGASQRLTAAGIVALVTMAVLWAWTKGGGAFAPLMIGVAAFVVLGALTDIVERTQLFRAPLPTSLSRARGLPRSTWGSAFAHAGLGIALIGIVCETTWNSESIASMQPKDVVTVGGYQVRLDDVTQQQGPNYREAISHFTVMLDARRSASCRRRSATSRRATCRPRRLHC